MPRRVSRSEASTWMKVLKSHPDTEPAEKPRKVLLPDRLRLLG